MNGKDIAIEDAALWFLPVEMRVPLKFGSQVLTGVTCARAKVRVRRGDGTVAEGWGETPLSVGWVWPTNVTPDPIAAEAANVTLDPDAANAAEEFLAYDAKENTMKDFCARIARELEACDLKGHALEIGHGLIEEVLPRLVAEVNAERPPGAAFPHLAALVCLSLFDIAIHDAYGRAHGVPVYETYGPEYLNRDLASYLEPAEDAAQVSFAGKYPSDFLEPRRETLPVWHLVGGLDPLEESDLSGDEPDDGYPVLLRDWIRKDGLNCLKVKLRGNDGPWDYERLLAIGRIAVEEGVEWLTTDFNCTVTDPAYVNAILDRLRDEEARVHQMILYVEQPFPHDLEAHRIDVHSVSARKPLFLDESAHDWRFVRMGRALGWTGVALKTCKTQTGALLSLCWAKAHGMTLMVQDLTNPMLAQVPHVLLAAHAGTIMGVESNGMQFYPAASLPEEAVHPGLFRRRGGVLDLGTVRGPGFGYREDEVERALPREEKLAR